MSREIKFRAWNPDTGKMTYVPNETGSYLHLGDTSIIGGLSWYVSDEGVSCAYADRGVLVQYTGLKDRNGREIYEGDILERTDQFGKKEDYLYVMDTFACGGFWATVSGSDGGRPPKKYSYLVSGSVINAQSFQFEVVGNLYENPDLLK